MEQKEPTYVFKATFTDVVTLKNFDRMFVFIPGSGKWEDREWLMAVASAEDVIRTSEKELILTALECLGLADLKEQPERSEPMNRNSQKALEDFKSWMEEMSYGIFSLKISARTSLCLARALGKNRLSEPIREKDVFWDDKEKSWKLMLSDTFQKTIPNEAFKINGKLPTFEEWISAVRNGKLDSKLLAIGMFGKTMLRELKTAEVID